MSDTEPQRRSLFTLPRLWRRGRARARPHAQSLPPSPLPSPPPQAGEGTGDHAPQRITIEWSRIVLPVLTLALGVAAWDLLVRLKDIPPYILPGPGLVAATIASDWPLLWNSLLATLATTFYGLALALAGGVGLAILFNQSRLIEHSLYPYAVILQVTPVVAVAPLLLIYLPQEAAVLACAWIVAFFPILANTTLGLNSVDRNLLDLFDIYGASRLKVLTRLKLPAALPYMLGGLRIAGGLSLVGAVVAEIAAGSAGAGSGLAYRIAESAYRLNIARMFAALILLSVTGIAIFFSLSLVSHLLLRRWHESALAGER
jgi:NitT/TauT family transport system permease protein